MKSTGMLRKIDELGRIVLPIEIRRALDVNSNDLLEIYVEDATIMLKKQELSCVFCGSTKNLSEFREHQICEKCREELLK